MLSDNGVVLPIRPLSPTFPIAYRRLSFRAFLTDPLLLSLDRYVSRSFGLSATKTGQKSSLSQPEDNVNNQRTKLQKKIFPLW